MNRIRPIEDKENTHWRKHTRALSDEEFEGWLGPAPENANNRGALGVIPGGARASLDAIIVSQEEGQDRRAKPRGHKTNPYDRKKAGPNAPSQISFSFITEEEEKARGSVNTQA